MGWFSRKEKKEERPKSAEVKIKLATNAPTDFPEVFLTYSLDDSPAAESFLQLAVAAELKRGFEKNGKGEISRLEGSLLHEKGVLRVPIEVAMKDGKKISVFIYPKADIDAVAKFNAIKQIFSKLKLPPPVYYSVASLPDTENISGLSLILL